MAGFFVLVCGNRRRTTLLGTFRASPFGPSAAPMFASASCLRSRRICLEQIRTAEGWPREAGLVPWMGPTILGRHANQDFFPWRVFGWDTRSEHFPRPPVPRPSGHRLHRCSLRHPASAVDNLSGTKLDSRRLAPQRAARKDWAHGWAQQSLAGGTQRGSTSKPTFCVAGGETSPTATPYAHHAWKFQPSLPRQSPQFHVA